ncbi:MAG TPA: farnesyl diphosphate synthase [Steroidobacteraceae bacterium]|nr:farnesyl diphosphate synthase [Steroidobacteraceae bacterium]
MTPMMNSQLAPLANFTQQLKQWQSRSEAALDARLPASHVSPERLHEAMRYSVLGGGKRVRPALVYATALTLGLNEKEVDGAACAVEMIHAYSLIHDDLPAMDDDDLRRGQPTCHKAFDEATAILAGDALQVLAFEVLATDNSLPGDAAIRVKLIQLLAQASGTFGMAGGQALDLAAQGQQLDIAGVTQIHQRKTGALISASVMMAAACDTSLSMQRRNALEDYARCLGLAFQIQDDLLDIEGDPALLGKPTGADQVHNKPTYPQVAGIAQAHADIRRLHAQALNTLQQFDNGAPLLAALADWLVLRTY